MIQQFREILAEIDAAGIVIDTNGTTEPNGNLCSISITNEQAAGLSEDDVICFMYDAAHRFDALRAAKSPQLPMTFSCWVDDQAGQLRFSVVSSVSLPFGFSVRRCGDAGIVAMEFINCPWLEGIQLSDLRDVGPDDDIDCTGSDSQPATLNVFCIALPLVHNDG